MPKYTARCDTCGAKHSYIRTVANRLDTPLCHEVPTVKVMDMPMVGAMSFTGHKGVTLAGRQQFIEDGASYKKFMRQNGFISETEGASEARIQTANREASDDAKLEAAVLEATQREIAK